MDKKTEKIIHNTFSLGSVRDASVFLSICVKNAFPDFYFRGIEVTNLMSGTKTVEGKSWNHALKVTRVEVNGNKAWEVSCHRISHGETADKTALLNTDLELM